MDRDKPVSMRHDREPHDEWPSDKLLASHGNLSVEPGSRLD